MTDQDESKREAIQVVTVESIEGGLTECSRLFDEIMAAKDAELTRLRAALADAQAAKRRALAIADERSKENAALRQALDRIANGIRGPHGVQLLTRFEMGEAARATLSRIRESGTTERDDDLSRLREQNAEMLAALRRMSFEVDSHITGRGARYSPEENRSYLASIIRRAEHPASAEGEGA